MGSDLCYPHDLCTVVNVLKGARERLQARGLSERASVPSLRLALAAEAAAEAAAAAAPAPGSPARRMCASRVFFLFINS